jgi:hypothetical protein
MLKNGQGLLLREYNQCGPTNPPKLWTLISADLAKARNTLSANAASHKALAEYQEFLNHNELELACDMLEAYAEDRKVT